MKKVEEGFKDSKFHKDNIEVDKDFHKTVQEALNSKDIKSIKSYPLKPWYIKYGGLAACLLIAALLITFNFNSINQYTIKVAGRIFDKEAVENPPNDENIVVQAPQLTSQPGTYEFDFTIYINNLKEGESAYYTLDGSEPTQLSPKYEDKGGIFIKRGSHTVKVIKVDDKGNRSEVVGGEYVVTLPEIAKLPVDHAGGDIITIGRDLLSMHLDSAKGSDIPIENRLKDYKINEVKIWEQRESEIVFTIEFDIQPLSDQSDWRPSGKPGENGWIIGNSRFVKVLKEQGYFIMTSWGTSP